MLTTASCKFPFLEEWKQICEKNKFCEVIDSVLSGYAQIAFNDNTFSGILMIIATYVASPVQAISGVWATLVATLMAYFIGAPRGLIRCGLYGFNAALVGVAVPVVAFPGSEVTLAMLLYSGLGAIISVILFGALGAIFSKYSVSSLALPYCVTLFFLVPASVLIGTMDVTRGAPALATLATAQAGWNVTEFIHASLAGIAQVLWVEVPIAGILYLIAVLFASRIDVISTIIGTVVGTGVAIALGLSKDLIMIGLFGYNSVLLMKVITRGFVLNARTWMLAICAAAFTPILAAGLRVIFSATGIGSFAAWPYALTCIAIFLGRDKFKNFTYVAPANWGVPETIKKDFKTENE